MDVNNDRSFSVIPPAPPAPPAPRRPVEQQTGSFQAAIRQEGEAANPFLRIERQLTSLSEVAERPETAVMTGAVYSQLGTILAQGDLNDPQTQERLQTFRDQLSRINNAVSQAAQANRNAQLEN